LRAREDLVALVGLREERHYAPRTLEREVDRLTERPRPPAPPGEVLLRPETVDRQLQRAAPVGRPSELVVDQPERAVREQVDPIDLSFDPHGSRTVGRHDLE